ncbi:MAG TPA: phage tail tape measure protein, partial [Anaerolineales bacterium]|nr:phage tail tape measure protein [Anaerolineales bacterium]
MAIQLGSAYGKVSLNTSGLTNGVKTGVAGLQQLQKAGVVLGNGMKAAGRTLTLGLTLPIVALGGAAISAASSFEETKNKAEVVFGEMADSVVSNANKASATLKLSKTEYLDYASSLGAIFTSGGMGIKEATELAEQSVKHIVDLGSFHEAAAADVSAAWQSAIRGQYEPIQRYFPFITNEFIKTYGTANGLLDSNTKNLTANQRAIILNAIALDEKLNPALNDMAETGGSLANQVKGTQAEFKNLLITLGENLLPIALEVVTTLNKMLAAFNNFSPVQQKMVLGFLAMAAAVGPLLSFLGTLVSTATGLIGLFGPGGVLAGAGTAITAMGTSISTIAVPALGALAAALLPILAVLAAVIATLAIFALAWKTNFLGIRDTMQFSIKFWTNIWKAFTSFLKGDTDAATEYLQEAWDAFVERFNKVFEKIFGIK